MSVIKINNLIVNEGERSVVDNISFSINPGEWLALIGESGSGKSTLARCILMLKKVDKGESWLNGESLHNMKKSELRKKQRSMQAIFQNTHDEKGSLYCSLFMGKIQENIKKKRK